VKDLCIAVFRKLSRNSLISAGALSRPVEAWVLSSTCVVLLSDIYLIPEWAGHSSGGAADFRIKKKRWAIECVRDRDELPEHIARFQAGGEIFQADHVGEIQQFINYHSLILGKSCRGRAEVWYDYALSLSTYSNIYQVGNTTSLLTC
jgi:hypothetical protein